MSIDVNFTVDDRLRLTSFLQAVKRGVPKRPLRFKRRLRATNDLPNAITRECLTVSDLFNVSVEQLKQFGAPNESVSKENRITRVSSEGNIFTITEQLENEQNVASEPCVRSGLSGVPFCRNHFEAPQTEWFSDHDHILADCQAIGSGSVYSDLLRLNKPAKKLVLAGEPMASHVSSRRQCPDIRRQLLPRDELPLLRTTTENALPDPHNIDAAFAILVTDTDPIEEIQEREGCFVPLKEGNGSSGSAQISRKSKGVLKSAISTKSSGQTRVQASNKVRQPRLSFANGRDGFSGSELGWFQDPKVRRRRRGKITLVDKKKPAVIGGLILASGLLPSVTLPASVDATRWSNAVKYNHCTSESHGCDLERHVRNQLSNVTAPIRCNSDSSGSNSATDEQEQTPNLCSDHMSALGEMGD